MFSGSSQNNLVSHYIKRIRSDCPFRTTFPLESIQDKGLTKEYFTLIWLLDWDSSGIGLLYEVWILVFLFRIQLKINESSRKIID